MDDQKNLASSDDDNTETPGEALDSSTGTGNIAGVLYLALFAFTAGLISYGLTFVWPSEDKSLVYLPRFLTSCVLAYLAISLLGLKPKS